jgi:hypothetical protein
VALAPKADTLRVRQAMARLEEVVTLLAGLVADENVTLDVAARLERIRDDLGGHLLAATTMHETDVAPDKVAAMLRRGAAVAGAGVAQIAALPQA